MRSLMPSYYALGICVALLAGCTSAANVAPAQGGGLVPNWNGATRAVAHGFTELHRSKKSEKLTSTSGSNGGLGCIISILVGGKAAGTYTGTFTGNGEFSPCPRHPGFGGGFAITSGTNKITGSFFGAGQGGCGRVGCNDGGKLTYKATLEPGGKTFSGKGNGAWAIVPMGVLTWT